MSESIFRIIDVFELVQIFETGKFRVSNASNFDDVNELSGNFFATTAVPGARPLTQDGMKKLKHNNKQLLKSYFCSSWTCERDNAALWNSYSPQRTSVQIEADISSIKKSFDSFQDKNSYAKSHGKPEKDPTVYYYHVECGKCKYVNLPDLHKMIENTFSDFEESIISGRLENSINTHAKFRKKQESLVKDFIFLKDDNYRYENEYRFLLQSVVRNNRSYEECKKDFIFGLCDTHLMPADGPNNIYIDIDMSIIKNVYLDRRCDKWKIDAIINIFNRYGFRVDISPAFANFLDSTEAVHTPFAE